MIEIVSFGYKYGTPPKAELYIDCRVLRNPFHIPKLKPLDGTNIEIQQYVLKDPKARPLLVKAIKFAGTTDNTTIAFGCTGGHHRSVAMACTLRTVLKAMLAPVQLTHRNLK
jgi:UPF0042 nucleotide-binding protein